MTVDHEDRSAAPPAPDPGPTRRARIGALIGKLVDAIRRGDDKAVEVAVVQLSQRKRWLAPLALIVGAFIMLFQGVKLLYTNWRLAVLQIVPAMWIWLAMLDIKLHVLHGKQFHVIRGPLLIPCIIGVTALTAASFYLNGVFAFAISVPGKPQIRPSFRGPTSTSASFWPGAALSVWRCRSRRSSPPAGATGPSSSARALSSAS